MTSVYELYFDGCSKGNPGRGGAGAVLYENGVEKVAGAWYVGNRVTNNVAEYMGMLRGMEMAYEYGVRGTLVVKGDSQLVIKQMRGEYQVKSPPLVPLAAQARDWVKRLGGPVDFVHIYREMNVRADALSNEGVDNRC